MREDNSGAAYEKVEVYFDGASRGNPGPAGIGVVLKSSTGTWHIKQFIGEKTNNEAEYLALLKALELAFTLGAKRVIAYSDSELLVKQLVGKYAVKEPRLARLYAKAKRMEEQITVEYRYVPREFNEQADRLANEAIDEAVGTKSRRTGSV